MPEMVERVARAMWERTHDGSWPEDADRTGHDNLDLYREDARAAIAAMREPTEAMGKAAATHCNERLRESSVIQSGRLSVPIFDIWRAMIDAALVDIA
jgi:DNA-binding LacI/PurR family transcriptional regulator